MNIRSSEQRRRLAAEQAAEWLLLLQSGKLSTRERGEFVDWLRESPVHVAEMLKLGRVDHALTEFTRWSEVAVAEQSHAGNVVALSDFTAATPQRRFSGAAFFYWASAASLAALAVLGVWLFLAHGQSVIRTQAGERRELALADGSIVDVAPYTELRIRLEDKQRLIKLTRGQAFFHVAKDASRPFIVDAGDTHVRAVGTAFDVSRTSLGVKVTVLEGKVAVIREPSVVYQAVGPKAVQPANVYVTANEQVVVSTTVAETPVRTVNSAAEVAWTEGNLVFNDETVAEVVRRFNRYNRAQIRVLDDELAVRHVSGVFKASDPDSFIAFVRSTTGDAVHDHPVILLDELAE